MNTFEITIQRKAGDGWPVVVEWHQSGVFLPVRSEDVLRLSDEALAELTALAYDTLAYGTLLDQAFSPARCCAPWTGRGQRATGDGDRWMIRLWNCPGDRARSGTRR